MKSKGSKVEEQEARDKRRMAIVVVVDLGLGQSHHKIGSSCAIFFMPTFFLAR